MRYLYNDETGQIVSKRYQGEASRSQAAKVALEELSIRRQYAADALTELSREYVVLRDLYLKELENERQCQSQVFGS